MKCRAFLLLGLVLAFGASRAQEPEPVWQWSTPMGGGRAFLWIPERCERVRGLVLAQHNMIEQGILEHRTMRATLAELNFAAVLIAPPFDRVFDFTRGAGERVDSLLRTLAAESGYAELATVPIAPLGHSACASFPWNFAAWAPERTLAVLSVKGDAPQTNLTGSGAANPAWDGARLAGIPGLMVMSEQEWWEDRLAPLERFRAAHPEVPLAVLCDTGHGHFDATDELVEYLMLFLRKAAAARLHPTGGALRSVDPRTGVQVRSRFPDTASPRRSFWTFDAEIARATEAIHHRDHGKHVQQVAFVQRNSLVPISTSHAGVELEFLPAADGLTLPLRGEFIAPLPKRAHVAAKDRAPPPAILQPVAATPGAHARGAVRIEWIVGPVRPSREGEFRVTLDRMASVRDPRALDAWLLARHPGDGQFRGAVQQARLRVPRFAVGLEQVIDFPAIPDQPGHTVEVPLAAKSSAELPVGYFVREGPAFVRDGRLHLTGVPPRARWPIRVTVVAWQLGRGTEPKALAATPVEQSFFWLKP